MNIFSFWLAIGCSQSARSKRTLGLRGFICTLELCTVMVYWMLSLVVASSIIVGGHQRWFALLRGWRLCGSSVTMWCWVCTIVKPSGEGSRDSWQLVLRCTMDGFSSSIKMASFTRFSNHLSSLAKTWTLLSQMSVPYLLDVDGQEWCVLKKSFFLMCLLFVEWQHSRVASLFNVWFVLIFLAKTR